MDEIYKNAKGQISAGIGPSSFPYPTIIAREYRVTAVVATGNATALLKDGQMVAVNGSAGTVKVKI